MFTVSFGRYRIYCEEGSSGEMEQYVARARLVERLESRSSDGIGNFSLAVADPSEDDWPFLVLLGSYQPAQPAFYPGVLVVPETNLLFIGAGSYLAAFDLLAPRKLWEDVADVGFWSWERHEGVVLMAAELELSAWDIQGQKLWSSFVEPPWSFSVEEGQVCLDVMGARSKFGLHEGPKIKPA